MEKSKCSCGKCVCQSEKGERKIVSVKSGAKSFLWVTSLMFMAVLTVGGSVWATSIGDSISVTGNSTFGDAAGDINIFTGTLQASTTALFTGAVTTYGNTTLGDASTDTLTVTATSTFSNGLTAAGGLVVSVGGFSVTNNSTLNGTLAVNGNTTLGDASTDTLTVTGTSITYSNAGTTTIPTSATSWAYATSSANIPLVRIDATNTRVGISTTTPGAALAVGGTGDAIVMGAGTSTLSIQSTGPSSGTGARGGCIELESPAGNAVFRLYATTSGLAVFETGSCR